MLRQCGILPQIIPAQIDEPAIRASLQAEAAPPRDVVDVLADLKAAKVSAQHPEAIVLGADQILVFEGRILAKSASIDEAKHQMSKLAGKTHQLLSAAVAYQSAKPVWRHIGKADLTMRPLSETKIAAYAASHGDALTETVGGYWIEEDGPTLFSRIDGDYFSILGLPLLQVLDFLRSRGIGAQ